MLREQLGDRRLRFTNDQRRRLAAKGRPLGRRALEEFAGIVTPETLLRWYRDLIAKKYHGSARRAVGRPASAAGVQQLVVRFASENPSWGYSRIRGALRNLGHELGRNTIKRILLDHGMEPAPTRRKRMPWHRGVSVVIFSEGGAESRTSPPHPRREGARSSFGTRRRPAHARRVQAHPGLSSARPGFAPGGHPGGHTQARCSASSLRG